MPPYTAVSEQDSTIGIETLAKTVKFLVKVTDRSKLEVCVKFT